MKTYIYAYISLLLFPLSALADDYPPTPVREIEVGMYFPGLDINEQGHLGYYYQFESTTPIIFGFDNKIKFHPTELPLNIDETGVSCAFMYRYLVDPTRGKYMSKTFDGMLYLSESTGFPRYLFIYIETEDNPLIEEILVNP